MANVTVTMRRTVYNAGGTLLNSGSQYSLAEAFAAELVGNGSATDTLGYFTPSTSSLSPAQVAQVASALASGSFSGSSVYGAAEALQLSVGSFTFTGGAGRFALNHQSVWHPLLANMPAFAGARPVVNWMINSDTPGAPTAWTTVTGSENSSSATTDTYGGATIGALNINNTVATNGGPYTYGYSGTWFGATVAAAPYASGQWATVNAWPPGTVMVMRGLVRIASGSTTNWYVYQRARDNSVAPTESQSGDFTIPSDFTIVSAAMEQNAAYTALGTRIAQQSTGATDARVAKLQLEDMTGDKGPYLPSEYVPSSTTPGWQWFGTSKSMTRTNDTYITNWAAMVPVKNPALSGANSAGFVTEGTGSALSNLNGLIMEPAASNLCSGWNTLARIGSFKSSGAMTSHTGVPFPAATTSIWYEAPSGMLVGNFNGTAPTDITLTLNGVSAGNDSIDSTTTNFVTAGFFVGMTIWVWRADTLTFGPMPVASVTATKIGLTGTFFGSTRASGTATRIMRCPGNGDNIMLLLNDGTAHRTTVSGAVSLPAAGTWDAKAGVNVTLAVAPSTAGGWASTDNGTKAYYWKDHTDFGISIAGGTGVTCKPVFDRQALIDAGLGYLCPSGLALEIYGGSGATTTVALGNTSSLGTAGRDTRISVYAKKISGSTMNVKLENGAHTATAALSGSTWARYTCTETSIGPQNIPTISNVTAGSITYVILWQTEQAASGETGVTSSPIVTFGDTAAKTRTATRCTRPWNGSAKNNIVRGIVWTPAFGALAQKQTLWSLYADASNYLELSITNTTMTWRKRRGGTNYDVTASCTPVAGTSVTLAWACKSTTGLRLSVDSVAATPNLTDLFDITALSAAAVEDIGSLNAASVAYGSFKSLTVS